MSRYNFSRRALGRGEMRRYVRGTSRRQQESDPLGSNTFSKAAFRYAFGVFYAASQGRPNPVSLSRRVWHLQRRGQCLAVRPLLAHFAAIPLRLSLSRALDLVESAELAADEMPHC